MTNKTPFRLRFISMLICSIVCILHPLQGQFSRYAPPSPVLEFKAYLETLDASNINSFNEAYVFYKSLVPRFSKVQADSAFLHFRAYFYSVVNYLNDTMWEDLDFVDRLHNRENNNDIDLIQFRLKLTRNGMGLYKLGNLYYIDQMPGAFLSRFSPYISHSTRLFLSNRRKELRAGFSDGEILLVDFKEIGRRIHVWETYLGKYPNDVMGNTAVSYYNSYLYTFFTGLRKSPTFTDSGVLKDGLGDIYDDFARKYANTDTGILVANYYKVLIGANFRWGPEIRQFFEENRIQNMHSSQAILR